MSGLPRSSRYAHPLARGFFIGVLFLCAFTLRASNTCKSDFGILLSPVISQDSVSSEELRESWRLFHDGVKRCPAGPQSDEGRAQMFRFLESIFTLDYDRLCERWLQDMPRAQRSGEGCFPESHRKRVSAYLDRIADPDRDLPYIDVFLRYGGAKGMSAFGRNGLARILGAATTASGYVGFHHPQTEAVRALGMIAEKSSAEIGGKDRDLIVSTLLSMLPSVDQILAPGHLPTPTVIAVIESLGKFDDPLVAERLSSWAAQMRQKYGREDLGEAAVQASEAIRARDSRKQ